MPKNKIQRPTINGTDRSLGNHYRARVASDSKAAGDLTAILQRNETEADMTADRMLSIVRRLSREAAMVERLAVLAARQEGLSWAQIGDGLGITKQAAQQRFTPKKPKPAPAPDEATLDLDAYLEAMEQDAATKEAWERM
jgi:hypothetical protein